MKNKLNKKNILKEGFTLIELLVVVVIIAILASVAITSYKKAVLKSKFSTLLPIAKTLYDSQEMFYLTHNNYTSNFNDLETPTTAIIEEEILNVNDNSFAIGNNARHSYVKASKIGLNNNYVMYQSQSKYFPGEIHCEAKTDNYLSNWLCEKYLKGTKLSRSLTEGYTDYVITGTGNGFFPKDYVNENKIKLIDGDTCTGIERITCHNSTYKNSYCTGYGYSTCSGNTYTNSTVETDVSSSSSGVDSKYINSTCIGNGSDSCRTSTYTNSTCIGNHSESCNGLNNSWDQRPSTFIDSTCIGNNSDTCTGNVFKGNSKCYANAEGACGTQSGRTNVPARDSVYQDNACCIGQYCPDYAPKC